MLSGLLLMVTLAAQPSGVWVLDVQGAIGPATADYVVRGLEDAQAAGAQAVILRMDTPGGLDQSMRSIIQAILSSTTPVIGYVAPQGARAASAGTYIMYACHLAAMAPATNLGAATPVQIGGGGLPTPSPPTSPPEEGDDQGKPPEQGKSSMEKKIINDAVAYIRSLAELRGRNADWAVEAVENAATLSAEQALEAKVIDLVADSDEALIKAVDGRSVKIGDREITLTLADAAIHRVEPDWRNEFLAVITDPSIAYILLLLGIYGLIFEFSNPGMGAPGIIGAICLLLGLYALQVLPVSYSALGLIVLGIALMAAEAMSPSFGVLGLGGLAAFVVGSIMLMDTELPAFRIAVPVIMAVTAVCAGLIFIIFRMLWQGRNHVSVIGLSTMVGQQARVSAIRDGQVVVMINGERWMAHCSDPLSVGDRVRVTRAEGLDLEVKKE